MDTDTNTLVVNKVSKLNFHSLKPRIIDFSILLVNKLKDIITFKAAVVYILITAA